MTEDNQNKPTDVIAKPVEYDTPQRSAENDGVESVSDNFTTDWSPTPSEYDEYMENLKSIMDEMREEAEYYFDIFLAIIDWF